MLRETIADNEHVADKTKTPVKIHLERPREPQHVRAPANLFPVRPGVTLLFVFLSCKDFDAKTLRALVADRHFRRPAADIANAVCVFGLGVGSQRSYLHALPPF